MMQLLYHAWHHFLPTSGALYGMPTPEFRGNSSHLHHFMTIHALSNDVVLLKDRQSTQSGVDMLC